MPQELIIHDDDDNIVDDDINIDGDVRKVNVNDFSDMPEHGYYRIKHDHENEYYQKEGFVAGELAYVIPGQKTVHVLINDRQWTYDDLDEFYNDFEFDPNGAAARTAEVTSLMQDLIKEGQYGQLSKQLIGFHPHSEEDSVVSTSTALTSVGGSKIQDVKKNVAETRNLVLRTQRDLKLKTKRLELLLSEQTRALSIKAKELSEMVKVAEEAIWTINLYLGKNEEIHRLASGKPASEEEKIALRQLVLYMDEECALKSSGGGIDAREIDQFDKWITADPANLQRVLPEQKGIVAFHIRRYLKEYEDPWTSAQLNEANIHWTYFLIRNGENIYRVFVDIVLGKNLFPSADEYDDLFADRENDDYTQEKQSLKPGSKQYMKAMEKSDAKRRHYLRVVLILQGLLDRTPIFKPMPVERINICNANECNEFIQLIYDYENVISDGRPKFSEWRRAANDKLEVGHRIVGAFDYRARLHGDGKYDEPRIYPRTARTPQSLVLHTIEKREEDSGQQALVILYERTGDTVYSRDYYRDSHEATVRARCKLYRNDKFILNFDAVTLEELRYYATSRTSRHEYEDMMPVLEVAIKLKEKEQADEAPFRLLLIGQLMKKHGASQIECEARVDELITWWKFKNRTHRALTSDDMKAIGMIVAEFGHRLKQESVRNRATQHNAEIIETILNNNQGRQVVLIAHKSNNKYVAYVAHNDNNVWVCEQTWTHNRVTNAISFSDHKDWKLVDKRHLRWNVIYKTERWDNWRINPQMSQVLTDQELQNAIEYAINYNDKNKRNLFDDDDEQDGRSRFVPLCAYYTDDFKIKFWYSDRGAIIPTELLISNRNDSPSVASTEITWERKKDGVVFRRKYPSHHCYTPGDVPWSEKYRHNHDSVNIIQIWNDNIAKLAEEFEQHRQLTKTVKELCHKYDYAVDLVSELMYKEKVAIAKKEFDSEYGDDELWEDHLKQLKIVKHEPGILARAFRIHAERDITVIGRTLASIFDTAIEHGLFEKDENDWRIRNEYTEIPNDIPLNFIVPEPPEVVDEDNEDED